MNEYSIFYADDDEDDLLFFEEAVESILSEGTKKINLHLLKNGEKLLETLSQKYTMNNIVFMDLNMPVKSGFEYLQDIRANTSISLTPVIMYSTSSNRESMVKSQDMGANYYAVKPSSFKDLMKIITKALSLDFRTDTAPPNDFLFNKLAV